MATAAPDALFIDTNILVYASIVEMDAHQVALDRLSALLAGGRELWASRQVLREYYAVMTRPNYFPRPLGPQAAALAVSTIAAYMNMCEESATATARLLELAQAHGIAGRQIHDCNIVACMNSHGVRTILTDNTRNFACYQGLIVVEPLR